VLIREAELVGGVSSHGFSGQSFMSLGGEQQLSYRFEFDRIDPVPADLRFRLIDIGRSQAGGPVLRLEPGAQAEWHGTTFTLEGVQVQDGRTVVTLQVRTDRSTKHLLGDYPSWAIRTKAGALVTDQGMGSTGGPPLRLAIHFSPALPAPGHTSAAGSFVYLVTGPSLQKG
jgi:hypothetical protein